MNNNSRIIRCALPPRGFTAGVLSNASIVRLSEVRRQGEESTGEEFNVSVTVSPHFKDSEGIHDYGRRTASAGNAKISEDQSTSRDLETKGLTYAGYYCLSYDDLKNFVHPDFFIYITASPKEGLPEHCDVVLVWNRVRQSTKKERRRSIEAIQVDLAGLLFGPERPSYYVLPNGEQTSAIDFVLNDTVKGRFVEQ